MWFYCVVCRNGKRSQREKDLLQGKEVWQAHSAQGDPVQGRQGLKLRSGLTFLYLHLQVDCNQILVVDDVIAVIFHFSTSRARDVMTTSKWVSVDKPSPSSTRRCVLTLIDELLSTVVHIALD